MAYIKKQVENGRVYYILVRSKREGEKVIQEVIRRFTDLDEVLDYCKKHKIKPPKVELIERHLAERIEKYLNKLNSIRPFPKQTLESLKKKFEIEATYHSNAIEGNRLSLKETYLVLEKGMTIGGRSFKEHLEATNHREAIHFVEELIKEKRRITESDILNLHAIILGNINPEWAGFYRNGQVRITFAEHKPPNYKLVPKLIGEVVELLNKKVRGTKAIEVAAEIHHKLVFIHPFWDGNGRLARLLANIKLMQAGFPPIVLKKRNRLSYYNALEKADKGDLGPLTSMIAREVEHTLKEYIEAFEES